MKPTIGRIVHYLAYGTPGGEYKSEPRAAIVTAVYTKLERVGLSEFKGAREEVEYVDLCVLNPTGMFFNRGVKEGDQPGQWSWPPMVRA
jgi:hypothetical protein